MLAGKGRGTVSRRRLMVGLGAGVMALPACVAGPAPWPSGKPAGDPADLDGVADLLRTRIENQHRGTGAVAASVDARGAVFASHGFSSLARTQAVGETSCFQIASLTKIFTAYLLADAVDRGEVALLDPLSRHVPGVAPSFEGREITLLDLATHTGGLPLRPPSRADRGQNNPYAGYSDEDLLADARGIRLTQAPGSAFAYSNFGYGLLGAALSHRMGQSYETLLRGRILEPLGMEATVLQPAAICAARMVQGYDSQFAPMEPWDFGALAPAGGLFSSLRDVGAFLSLWFDDRGAMSRIAREMLVPRRPGDDAQTSMALGWRVSERNGKSIVWSNGTGGGVRSFMGVELASRRASMAFINMATGTGVDDIGFHILDPASPVDTTVTPQRVAIDLPAATLDRYSGRYQFAPGDVIDIVRTDDGLALVQGAQRILLFAETPTRFFIREDDVTVEFPEIGADGRPERFLLVQSGQTFDYQRLD